LLIVIFFSFFESLLDENNEFFLIGKPFFYTIGATICFKKNKFFLIVSK